MVRRDDLAYLIIVQTCGTPFVRVYCQALEDMKDCFLEVTYRNNFETCSRMEYRQAVTVERV